MLTTDAEVYVTALAVGDMFADPTYQRDRRDAFDSPIVNGVALVLYYLNAEIEGPRLAECLMDNQPRHLKSSATALRDFTAGSTAVLTAIAIMAIYNKRPGKKLLVSNRTFGGGSVNARSVTA